MLKFSPLLLLSVVSVHGQCELGNRGAGGRCAPPGPAWSRGGEVPRGRLYMGKVEPPTTTTRAFWSIIPSGWTHRHPEETWYYDREQQDANLEMENDTNDDTDSEHDLKGDSNLSQGALVASTSGRSLLQTGKSRRDDRDCHMRCCCKSACNPREPRRQIRCRPSVFQHPPDHR